MDFFKFLFNQNQTKPADITVVKSTSTQDSELRKLQQQCKIPDAIAPGEGQGLFVSSMSALRRIDDRVYDETKTKFDAVQSNQKQINQELMKTQKQLQQRKQYEKFEQQLMQMQVLFNQVQGEVKELAKLLD